MVIRRCRRASNMRSSISAGQRSNYHRAMDGHLRPDKPWAATGKSLIVLNPWLTLNQRVPGSSPGAPTKQDQALATIANQNGPSWETGSICSEHFRSSYENTRFLELASPGIEDYSAEFEEQSNLVWNGHKCTPRGDIHEKIAESKTKGKR